MYIITTSTVIYKQQICFFTGIRYFNPSQKYFSTALITSISSVIHQIAYCYKRSTKPVRFCWPLTFGPIDRCPVILASLFVWFQI